MIELDINVVQKNIRQIRMTTYQKDFPRSAQDSDSRTPEHPRAFQDQKSAQLAHLFPVSKISRKKKRRKQFLDYKIFISRVRKTSCSPMETLLTNKSISLTRRTMNFIKSVAL